MTLFWLVTKPSIKVDDALLFHDSDKIVDTNKNRATRYKKYKIPKRIFAEKPILLHKS